MSYKLKFEKNALKKLTKLDSNQRIILMSWIQKNLDQCDNPWGCGKALSGDLNQYWSYRVGDYRILVEIYNNEIVLTNISLSNYRDIIKSLWIKPKSYKSLIRFFW